MLHAAFVPTLIAAACVAEILCGTMFFYVDAQATEARRGDDDTAGAETAKRPERASMVQ